MTSFELRGSRIYPEDLESQAVDCGACEEHEIVMLSMGEGSHAHHGGIPILVKEDHENLKEINGEQVNGEQLERIGFEIGPAMTKGDDRNEELDRNCEHTVHPACAPSSFGDIQMSKIEDVGIQHHVNIEMNNDQLESVDPDEKKDQALHITKMPTWEVVIPMEPVSLPRDSESGALERSSSKSNETMLRCQSTFSTDSLSDCCRICQQHTDELLIELGCHCRGELAKAHRPCIEQWFANKGSNKCEICQNVATNVAVPVAQPTQHFWVWRLGGAQGASNLAHRRRGGSTRFHPLWAALLILIAGLLFDVLISIFLGASALPVNIIIGVLVVLGIGTAARLVIECWHERGYRRNMRTMESNFIHLQGDSIVGIHGNILQGQSAFMVQPASVRPIT